jgi:DNA-binding transcriptional LysR family regulator
MRWIGTHDCDPQALIAGPEPVPLVLFDAPCLMRTAATNALDKAGIAWRVAFTSPSLGGVWAAVAAGLGVTVRTEVGLPSRLRTLDTSALPPLPKVGLDLLFGVADPSPVVGRLRDVVLETVAQHAPK